MKQLNIRLNVFKVLVGYAPFIMYVLFVSIIYSIVDYSNAYGYISNLIGVVNPMIFIIITVFFIIALSRDGDIKRTRWIIRMLCFVMFLQFFFTLVGYLNPNIQQTINDIVVSNTKNEVTAKAVKAASGIRVYGFSGYYFDYFGVVTSMLISLVFLKGMSDKNISYIIGSVLLLFVPMINGRTGLMLSGISIAVILLLYFKKANIILKSKIVVAFVLLLFLITVMFSYLPGHLQRWITQGFDATVSLLKGEGAVGVYASILGTDMVLPQNCLDLLFGIGKRIEDAGVVDSTGGRIDSGYVQSIWRFGVLGTCLLLGGYINMFRIIIKTGTHFSKCVGWVLSFIVLLFFFKGSPISNHGFNFVLFTITILIVNQQKSLRQINSIQ